MNEANVPIFPVALGNVEQAPERSEAIPILEVTLGGRGQWVKPGTAYFYSAATCPIHNFKHAQINHKATALQRIFHWGRGGGILAKTVPP